MFSTGDFSLQLLEMWSILLLFLAAVGQAALPSPQLVQGSINLSQ